MNGTIASALNRALMGRWSEARGSWVPKFVGRGSIARGSKVRGSWVV